jgi:hypothetical protein
MFAGMVGQQLRDVPQRGQMISAGGLRPRRRSRKMSPPMKSAYELAMERLEKTKPSVSLTDEQKAQIAEIDSSYRAKIAEKELFLKDQIRTARGGGNHGEAESLEKQLAIEIRRLQEDCEEKKEKLRRSFGS